MQSTWWIWLVVGLAAAIAEIVGSGMLFAGVALAALVALAFAVFGASLWVDAVVFAVLSAGYVIGLRPIVLRLVSGQRPVHGSLAAHASLMGRRALVTQPVSADGGQILVGQGEFWTAKLYQGTDEIPIGAKVEIVFVEGLTALVIPAETAPPLVTDQSSSEG